MEKTEDFYLTLDSHETRFKNAGNNSDFKIRVPNGISLSNSSKWEVGLVDGCIPNKTYNVSDDRHNIFYFIIRNSMFKRLNPYTHIYEYTSVPYNVGPPPDNIREWDYRKTLATVWWNNINKKLRNLLDQRGPLSDDEFNIHRDNRMTCLPFEIDNGV